MAIILIAAAGLLAGRVQGPIHNNPIIIVILHCFPAKEIGLSIFSLCPSQHSVQRMQFDSHNVEDGEQKDDLSHEASLSTLIPPVCRSGCLRPSPRVQRAANLPCIKGQHDSVEWTPRQCIGIMGRGVSAGH